MCVSDGSDHETSPLDSDWRINTSHCNTEGRVTSSQTAIFLSHKPSQGYRRVLSPRPHADKKVDLFFLNPEGHDSSLINKLYNTDFYRQAQSEPPTTSWVRPLQASSDRSDMPPALRPQQRDLWVMTPDLCMPSGSAGGLCSDSTGWHCSRTKGGCVCVSVSWVHVWIWRGLREGLQIE